MKTLMFFCLILCLTLISAQEYAPAMQKDSVNIRAILKEQIAQIKNREEYNTSSLPAEEQQATSGSENLFIRIFILTDLSLGIILFLLWRRRNIKIRDVEKSWLKKNVMRLREDKITARENKELRKLRKQLRLEPVCNSGNAEYVSQYAKQQSISKGELMLASRLNSYKRVQDVNTGL